MREKTKQNKKRSSFLSYKINDDSHNISIKGDKKYRKNSQSNPSTRKSRLKNALLRKIVNIIKRGFIVIIDEKRELKLSLRVSAIEGKLAAE